MTLPCRNSASFAITSDGVETTDQRAELHVGIEGLGALLLGGATWRSLAAAGQAQTDDPARSPWPINYSRCPTPLLGGLLLADARLGPAYCGRNGLRSFGLRIMAYTNEFRYLRTRQHRGRLLEDVTPRDRIVGPPHQVQRAVPVGQRLLPPAMMHGAFGVVADEPIRELVAIVSGTRTRDRRVLVGEP